MTAAAAFRFELTTRPAGPVAPRTGRLHTAHGIVETPVFMPVGTLATVKTLLPAEVAETGASIILVNAYHLYLRPGHRLIERLGGVHRFMRWDRPILSDSGGFQVFSLASLRKVTEDGVRFRSHIDGSEHHYTPELAMEVQQALGVDIAMPLDHVVPGDAPYEAAAEAVQRTLRWYRRCREAAPGLPTFAIIQGGTHPALRRYHAREALQAEPPGFSIGGLSVGEPKARMWETVELTNAELPIERPRYLMGVGSPEDLVEGIARGIDMFDCVLPTRLGRNGALFTDTGRLTIRNAANREVDAPPDPVCDCLACRQFSLAYLHHLFRNDELLGHRLATHHNLRYLARLVERARQAIRDGSFEQFRREFLARYRTADEEARLASRRRM
ncbi:tRNA guanosine(34) transglycosylase Tgt [Tepidiforma thermophila]|uniref:Queuine tRNA-ribosyltransferase n=1 Tax=Tepidiforma thermophila (strain KCTC 52669 / CGMCC 1.13589 / G233) TaxID=2761530 RepID=A0A2A9HG93_TEPT2|nr:tRNA guanosine(34) transglycosylase Tgt [Tepidiforma thermophila]PFG75044.1 queuine tRNA-ribosyltransferase [Tepidiforma thermophila]